MTDPVTIKWIWQDVADQRPDWTEEQCCNFLDEIRDDLEDRSIERGWEVIHDKLHECNLHEMLTAKYRKL